MELVSSITSYSETRLEMTLLLGLPQDRDINAFYSTINLFKKNMASGIISLYKHDEKQFYGTTIEWFQQ